MATLHTTTTRGLRVLQLHLQLRLVLLMSAPLRQRARDERGDVPGWVMITVMSAGLVAVIGAIAGDELGQMLRSALNSVK